MDSGIIFMIIIIYFYSNYYYRTYREKRNRIIEFFRAPYMEVDSYNFPTDYYSDVRIPTT